MPAAKFSFHYQVTWPGHPPHLISARYAFSGVSSILYIFCLHFGKSTGFFTRYSDLSYPQLRPQRLHCLGVMLFANTKPKQASRQSEAQPLLSVIPRGEYPGKRRAPVLRPTPPCIRPPFSTPFPVRNPRLQWHLGIGNSVLLFGISSVGMANAQSAQR